ncbi:MULTISPECIES: DUF6461 domain-containing protein [unclassified Nonomuraea]|uniref:DUF6461 domain-containing protein n=1 Tax=unclassified Nonomuraea TaxID=2593643 RepID=UPI0033F9A86C
MDYYTDLLRSSATFNEALAWTVIVPLSEPLSLDAVASRVIGGGHPLLMESGEEFDEEAEFLAGHAVYLGHSGDTVMLLEPGGFSYVATPQVMAWLSQDAQVWHLSWNHTGSKVLEYWADGQQLTRIPGLDALSVHGADPAELQEEVAALAQAGRASWTTRKATAMALIERRSGARLPIDWFDEAHPVAVVDPPIGDDCPPIGLWHHEPDLNAKLRSASHEQRRAVLLHVTGILVERFDLSLPAITRAVRIARGGEPVDDALLEGVREAWEHLGARWAGRGYAVREEDDNAWRRWVAANAVRHSLRSLNEGASFLDGLTYAMFALPEEWPTIRAWIRETTPDADGQ